MSEHDGSKSPGAPAKADDPVTALAKDIFARLAAATYGGGKAGEADAKELGKLSLRLAAAFMQAWEEANAEALAAERKRRSFSADDLDIESLLKK
ncbi:MAG: hypothetical protein N2653_10735 [Burkholderiales bacterium]|nr:hypothetical protein [Burkholderiales bacterium]